MHFPVSQQDADNPIPQPQCIAFEGFRLVAAGPLRDVAIEVKQVTDRGETEPLLVFDQWTSHPVELDLRGTVDDVVERIDRWATENAHPGESGASVDAEAPTAPPKRRGPGRPKLGVVGKEVTLFPRHWEWLGRQRGGASVTLRKLVDRARKENEMAETHQLAQESAYRFLSAIAGNLQDFEEAIRALFANDVAGFRLRTRTWPEAVRAHARDLADRAFQSVPGSRGSVKGE